jgi:hypothetical protein
MSSKVCLGEDYDDNTENEGNYDHEMQESEEEIVDESSSYRA